MKKNNKPVNKLPIVVIVAVMVIILVPVVAVVILNIRHSNTPKPVKTASKDCVVEVACSGSFPEYLKNIMSAVDCINYQKKDITLEAFVGNLATSSCPEPESVDFNNDGMNEYVFRTGEYCDAAVLLGSFNGKLSYLLINKPEDLPEDENELAGYRGFRCDIYGILDLKDRNKCVLFETDRGGNGRFHHFVFVAAGLVNGMFTEMFRMNADIELVDADNDNFKEISVYKYLNPEQMGAIRLIYAYDQGKFNDATDKYPEYVKQKLKEDNPQSPYEGLKKYYDELPEVYKKIMSEEDEAAGK